MAHSSASANSREVDGRDLAFSIAYRMLGTVSEAEDVVQEAQLRLHRALQEGQAVESPKAFLAAITTRLAIDQLRSARARREIYVGHWLPEPLPEEKEPAMARNVEMAESLSMAFLLILETLSPVERAVFLLREVFEYEYSDIAKIIDKSEDNCRQIFARAKRHVGAGKPRFEPSTSERDELAARFFAACRHGDLQELVQLLAKDAAFYGDGGGKAMAVLNPVRGADRVARLMAGLAAKGLAAGITMRLTTINGQPGALTFDPEGRLINVFSLEIVEGVIRTVRGVVNPDKLRHLGPLSDLAVIPNRAAPPNSES
jgi:RNA polymerase sigma-70 factor, ECF subfamily